MNNFRSLTYMIYAFMLGALVLLPFIAYAVGESIVNYAAFVFGGLYFFLVLQNRKVFLENFFSIEVLLAALCIVFSLFSLRYSTIGGLYVSISLFFAVFGARHFVIYKCSFYKYKVLIFQISAVFLWSMYAFFIYKAIFVGADKYALNEYFPNSSRNMVSAVVIVAQIFYSFSFFVFKGKAPKLTPIISFSFCVIAYGRSGIILSAIVMVVSILHGFFYEQGKERAVYALMAVFVAFCFLVYIDFDAVYGLVFEQTNLATGLKSVRSQVNYQYLISLDFLSFFIGQDYSVVPLIIELDENPHNSFIHGHHFMGIAFMMLVICVLFRAFSALCFGRVALVFLFVMVLMVRAFVDVFLFPGSMSFVFFVLYFYMVFRSRVHTKSAAPLV